MNLTDLIVPGAAVVTGLGFGGVAIFIDKPGPGQHPAPRGSAEHGNWAAAAAALHLPAATAAVRRAWRRARALLAMARDGEPRCATCQCRTDALCGHACCAFMPAPVVRFVVPAEVDAAVLAELAHAPNARAGLWQPRPVPPADRPWLPATPQNPGQPDVEDLDNTGTMAALVDWATSAPLGEVKHG